MKAALELLAMNTLPPNRKSIALRAIVEAIVAVNWNYMLEHPTPTIAELARSQLVRVSRKPTETWNDIPSIIANGIGSPKDFVCWRIAELRHVGTDDVYPFIKTSYPEPGVSLVELFVRVGENIEDPCKAFEIAVAD